MLRFTIVLLLATVATARADENYSWVEHKLPELPTESSWDSMAYDSIRHVVVRFDAATGYTWEWDGVVWKKVATSGPARALCTAAAFDEDRGVVILFGGTTDFSRNQQTRYYSTTWQWDGASWTDLQVTGPIARYGHTLTYDAGRKKMVLFGGVGKDKYLADAWEWNGEYWEQISSEGPPPRYAHVGTYDSKRGVSLICGGFYSGKYQRDMWGWDGSTWTKVCDLDFSAYKFAGAYDAVRDRLVVHIGDPPQTWEWDGESWSLRVDSEDLLTREGPAMTFDAQRKVCVLFGKSRYIAAQRETFAWDGDRWRAIGGCPPTSRFGAAMVYSESSSELLLLGGYLAPPVEGSFDGTLYGLDSELWPRHRPPEPVPNLAGHGLVDDVARSRVLAITGTSYDSRSNYEWDGTDWKTRAAAVDLCKAGVAYDRSRERTVVFGGAEPDYQRLDYADTLEWDGDHWTKLNVSGPEKRRECAMTYDIKRGVCVLFGGCDYDKHIYGDTWEFDGSAWTKVATDGPTARWGARMGYDSKRERIVLTGGAKGFDKNDTFGDTWTWDGQSWTQLGVKDFVPRTSHAFGYDPTRDVFVIFGGTSDGANKKYLSDHWELSADPAPADCNCDGHIDFDDIDYFVAGLLSDFSAYVLGGGSRACWDRRLSWGDFDGNGAIDFADVDGFIAALLR